MDGPLDGPTVTITGETADGTTSLTSTASEQLGELFIRIAVQN